MENTIESSTAEIVETLIANGGKLWEKGGKRRIYFNSSAWGLKAWYYKTGNVSGAEINGATISNSEASRCLGVKVWYDLDDGRFYTQGTERLHSVAQSAIREFVQALQDKL